MKYHPPFVFTQKVLGFSSSFWLSVLSQGTGLSQTFTIKSHSVTLQWHKLATAELWHVMTSTTEIRPNYCDLTHLQSCTASIHRAIAPETIRDSCESQTRLNWTQETGILKNHNCITQFVDPCSRCLLEDFGWDTHMLFKNRSVKNPGGNYRADYILPWSHIRDITQSMCWLMGREWSCTAEQSDGKVRCSPWADPCSVWSFCP